MRLLDPHTPFDDLVTQFKWHVPDRFNMAEVCVFRHARTQPDAVALVDRSGDRRVVTYAELADETLRFAALLSQSGVKRGDRVAILLPQGPATLIAHFAAYALGAIALPLFTLFGPAALQFRLADSAAKVLVTQSDQLAKISPLRGDLPTLSTVFSVDGGADDFWATARAGPLEGMVDTQAEDPAVMIYTSGTTGDPKGVLHAHRFLLGHLPCMELGHCGFPAADDVGWTPADWAWIGGLMDMAMPCLYYGIPLIAKRFAKFDVGQALALMEEESVTRSFLPPTALKLMRQADVPTTARLRSITSGGEPLGNDLITWANKTFGAEVNELYGQTECNLCVGSARSLGVAKEGTLGKAFPGFDVAILDDAGKRLPDGQQGQIAVRRGAASMMLEYWRQPTKTTQKFAGDWLLTGDVGVRDADGYFTFVARDDDVITSAGYRIGPAEVEASLARDPDVVMAAVVGAPDAVKGHVVVAFVTLAGPLPTGFEARLIDRVRQEISPHVAPKHVYVIEDMPMTATGKIQRKVLRDGLKT